jgi:hypothetical protein
MTLIRLSSLTVIQHRRLLHLVFLNTESSMAVLITVNKEMPSIGRSFGALSSLAFKLTNPQRGSNDDQQKELMDLT